MSSMSLATARRAAQARIEKAISHPQYHIIIWDPDGQFVERFGVGGYIGKVGSKINYSLRPDVEGQDHAVIKIENLLDGGEETGMRDGCTGSWTLDNGGGMSDGKRKNGNGGGRHPGKGKEGWWHVERGRWREVGLERFF